MTVTGALQKRQPFHPTEEIRLLPYITESNFAEWIVA